MPTIRYYEQIGLLPALPAHFGKQAALRRRRTTEARVHPYIARELGFEIDAIRTLLVLQDDAKQPCNAADAIARARLGEVEQRIASLSALKTELQLMIEGCSHGRVDRCRVIEVLADHGKCAHPRH